MPVDRYVSVLETGRSRHDRSSAPHWNPTRVEWVSAILIAMTAGYLDGYGLHFLKTYVSFMSGNTTSTGLNTGRDDLLTALPSALAIVCFVAGSFFGNLISGSRLTNSHRILFGLIGGPSGPSRC